MEICYLDENVSKLDADYELYCSFQYYFGECKSKELIIFKNKNNTLK